MGYTLPLLVFVHHNKHVLVASIKYNQYWCLYIHMGLLDYCLYKQTVDLQSTHVFMQRSDINVLYVHVKSMVLIQSMCRTAHASLAC